MTGPICVQCMTGRQPKTFLSGKPPAMRLYERACPDSLCDAIEVLHDTCLLDRMIETGHAIRYIRDIPDE